MPHTEKCRAAIRELYDVFDAYDRNYLNGCCVGAGCTFTREDAPALWDLLVGSKGYQAIKQERRMPMFEVTEDHLKLVQRMYWDWDGGAYYGAPCVGLKRPYGNSDVQYDIVEILGWDAPWEQYDGEMDEDTYERAMKIHREMDTVLQIATCTLSFEVGTYKKTELYSNTSWKKVDDEA